jgi:hypothetical protein
VQEKRLASTVQKTGTEPIQAHPSTNYYYYYTGVISHDHHYKLIKQPEPAPPYGRYHWAVRAQGNPMSKDNKSANREQAPSSQNSQSDPGSNGVLKYHVGDHLALRYKVLATHPDDRFKGLTSEKPYLLLAGGSKVYTSKIFAEKLEPFTKPPIDIAENLVVSANDIEAKQVSWLWKHRIAFRFINMLAGKTGSGKTFLALDIAAHYTRRRAWPDGADNACEPGNVLIISEDSQEYMLKPRLMKLGADLSRVFFMTWDAMMAYSLANTAILSKAYQQSGNPGLVLIDPPANFLGDVKEDKNDEVRKCLMNIVKWLFDQKQDVAIIMNTHINKNNKYNEAIDRIMGSTAWGSTSRIVHTLTVHEDEDEQEYTEFSCPKSNIGIIPTGLRFRCAPDGDLARVDWLGESDKSANEAMACSDAASKKKDKRYEEAAIFLFDLMKVPQIMFVSDIYDTMGNAGFLGILNDCNEWTNKKLLYRAVKRIKTLTGDRTGYEVIQSKHHRPLVSVNGRERWWLKPVKQPIDPLPDATTPPQTAS